MGRSRLRRLAVLLLTAGPLALAPGPASSRAATAALVDRAQSAGLSIVERTWEASTVDYNSDGRQDVWVGLHQRGGRLYRNNGDGTYTRVAEDAWPVKNAQGGVFDRHHCAWADVDADGRPDAYCAGGRNTDTDNYVKTAEKDNELWLQLAPGRFTDVGTEWGVGDPCGRGRYVAFLDVNRDGRPDLFVGNQALVKDPSDPCQDPARGLPNGASKIFLNNGGRGFVYAPKWNVSQPHAGVRCAVPLDFNHDGRIDLLACHFRAFRPYLYRNDGAGFTEVGSSLAFQPTGDAVTADLNKDGRLDLVLALTSGFGYRLGTRSGFGPTVQVAAVPKGTVPREVAAGDIDGDGDLDIYGLVDSADGSSNPNDIVRLNTNMSFATALAVPSAGGRGDTVTALRRGARAQFLVLNGQLTTAGPTQLIALP